MARYKLTFKKSVARDLRALAERDVRRILERIDALVDDPRGPGCSKLSRQNYYRVRVGVYRVAYEIDDGVLVIQVIRVAHRARAYR